MIKTLRMINTIDTWDGVTEDDSVITHTDESLFLAKDEDDRIGILNRDESVFIPFGYDSITPLGFNLWQLSKNGKVGAISLKYAENMKLCIEWRLPCEYDYISAEDGNVVYASKYYLDNSKDVKSIYFVHIDEKAEGGYCDRIVWNYYYVSSNLGGERKYFIVNAKTGQKHFFDKDYTLIGGKSTEDNEHYLMFEDFSPNSEKGMIVYISEEGVITESCFYDDIPTVLYSVDTDGMDEAVPIAFIGKRKGQYYYLDSSLKEYAHAFESLRIETLLSGKTIDGDEMDKSISRFFIRSQAVKVIDAAIPDE